MNTGPVTAHKPLNTFSLPFRYRRWICRPYLCGSLSVYPYRYVVDDPDDDMYVLQCIRYETRTSGTLDPQICPCILQCRRISLTHDRYVDAVRVSSIHHLSAIMPMYAIRWDATYGRHGGLQSMRYNHSQSMIARNNAVYTEPNTAPPTSCAGVCFLLT